MADRSNHNSYLRDDYGPRGVAAGEGHGKSRSRSRRHRDGDDREKRAAERSASDRHTRREFSSRSTVSNSQPSAVALEQPSLELDVIGQPLKGVTLGVPVETSVMVSLKLPTRERAVDVNTIDTSRLFAACSLVADAGDGACVPLEPGSLTGQKMFDSVHPIPVECLGPISRSQPSRVALGYFSFPGLLIRQAGTYRLRTTLIQITQSTGASALSLLAIDSEPVQVERRGPCVGGIQRRVQQVYA